LRAPSLARLRLLAVRNLPSQGGNTGSNPVGGSNHLPVAQMDERPATNREACRFDSCREGQSAGCSSVGRAPRLGRGGRRIVTCHPDQIPLSLNGRAPRSERGYGGSIPSRGANPGAVAKRERGALQKRHESARHRPAPPKICTSMLSWREWIGRRLLSGRTRVRILLGARSRSSTG
jgi:hypothetical protein